jgi:hypothetical protein
MKLLSGLAVALLTFAFGLTAAAASPLQVQEQRRQGVQGADITFNTANGQSTTLNFPLDGIWHATGSL